MRLGTMFSLTMPKSILLIFLFSFFPNNIAAQSAQPFLINTFCSETAGNFSSGSLYQTNLVTVLTELITQASASMFYNTSSGTDTDNVFGLYYCRESQCQDCIKAAAQKLLDDCPTGMEATAYYTGCTLRYADHSIFSVVEETPAAEYHTDETVPDPDEFGPVLNETMDSAIQMAAFGTDPSLLGVGGRTVNLSSGSTLLCVAQCSLDVTGIPCSKCLRAAFTIVPVCCEGSIGTWVFLPSCDVLYIVSLSNDTSSTESPPPLPSSTSLPPPPVTSEIIASPPPPVTSDIISSPPPVGQDKSNPFLPGNSGGRTLNCGCCSVRFGLLIALIIIVL